MAMFLYDMTNKTGIIDETEFFTKQKKLTMPNKYVQLT